MPNQNICVVGAGPFTLHSHFKILAEMGLEPRFVVDLDDQETLLVHALDAYGFKDTHLVLLPSQLRNQRQLPSEVSAHLNQLVEKYQVTHAILATEPKARFAYLTHFIQKGIHCFCDKPLITVPQVSTREDAATQFEQDIKTIFLLYADAQKNGTRVDVNFNRRLRPEILQALKVISEVPKDISPITHIGINYSGGKWEFPHEFTQRENHPHKYGYGMLFHSGVHFVDLVAYLLGSRQPEVLTGDIEIIARVHRVSDWCAQVSPRAYTQYFPNYPAQKHMADLDTQKEPLGEVDLFLIIQFRKANQILTTATLNLRMCGPNLRETSKTPLDLYANIGRLRHERLEIELGPFLNLKLEHCQTRKDKIIAGLTQIDAALDQMLVFRNSHVLHGKTFERVELESLRKNSSQKSLPLIRFLQGAESPCELSQLKFTHDLLAKINRSLYQPLTQPLAGGVG